MTVGSPTGHRHLKRAHYGYVPGTRPHSVLRTRAKYPPGIPAHHLVRVRGPPSACPCRLTAPPLAPLTTAYLAPLTGAQNAVAALAVRADGEAVTGAAVPALRAAVHAAAARLVEADHCVARASAAVRVTNQTII
eukprot:1144332-Prorocentrum_minimum.AAC.3